MHTIRPHTVADYEEAKIKAERKAFIAAYSHLDLTEDKDAWGHPKFSHDMIEAMWSGWKHRAFR